MDSQVNTPSFRGTDDGELQDIRSVYIDRELPEPERIRRFVEQIRNPYRYLDNGLIVEVAYTDGAASLAERLAAFGPEPDGEAGRIC